eukprot:UN1468
MGVLGWGRRVDLGERGELLHGSGLGARRSAQSAAHLHDRRLPGHALQRLAPGQMRRQLGRPARHAEALRPEDALLFERPAGQLRREGHGAHEGQWPLRHSAGILLRHGGRQHHRGPLPRARGGAPVGAHRLLQLSAAARREVREAVQGALHAAGSASLGAEGQARRLCIADGGGLGEPVLKKDGRKDVQERRCHGAQRGSRAAEERQRGEECLQKGREGDVQVLRDCHKGRVEVGAATKRSSIIFRLCKVTCQTYADDQLSGQIAK